LPRSGLMSTACREGGASANRLVSGVPRQV
jgi:hypothetical protein